MIRLIYLLRQRSLTSFPPPLVVNLTVVLGAALLVLAIGVRTNYLPPKWDTLYYLDMAQNGLQGNPHLAAPFAYRPAAPLLVHSLTLMLHADPQVTFRWCNRPMCVVFIVSSFYFCRFLNATPSTASFASALVSLYFFTVKWIIFSGEMVDIYACPLILLSFAALLRTRPYVCLSFAQPGCSSKNFYSCRCLRRQFSQSEKGGVRRGSPLFFLRPFSFYLSVFSSRVF